MNSKLFENVREYRNGMKLVGSSKALTYTKVKLELSRGYLKVDFGVARFKVKVGSEAEMFIRDHSPYDPYKMIYDGDTKMTVNMTHYCEDLDELVQTYRFLVFHGRR